MANSPFQLQPIVDFTLTDDVLISGNDANYISSGFGTISMGEAAITLTFGGAGSQTVRYLLVPRNTRLGLPIAVTSNMFYYALTGLGVIASNRLYKINTAGTATNIDNDTTPITSGTGHSSSSLPYTLAAGEALLLELVLQGLGAGSVSINSINVAYHN